MALCLVPWSQGTRESPSEAPLHGLRCSSSSAPPAAFWKPLTPSSPQAFPGLGSGAAGREGCRPLPASGPGPLLAAPWAVATAVTHTAGAGVTQRSGQPAGRLPAAAAGFLSSRRRGVRASAHVGAGSSHPSRHHLALAGHPAGAVRAAAPKCLR